MIIQHPARILIAAHHTVEENENFRTITLVHNAEDFEDIPLVGNETLAAGHTQALPQIGKTLLLLPVTGKIEVNCAGEEFVCAPGTLVLIQDSADKSITVSNAETGNLVNYYRLHLDAALNMRSQMQQYQFDLDAELNTIVPLYKDDACAVSLAKMQMRKEDTYLKGHAGSKLYTFTIQGSVEVQGRLMHPYDALSLWEIEEAEIESFSKESILLLVEKY